MIGRLGPLVLSGLLLGCGGDNGSAATTSTVPASTTTRVRTAADPPDPCALLRAEDFASAGVLLEGPGVDFTHHFGLATDTSAACHWEGAAAGIGGNWELLIGRGHAAEAYEFDRGFAELDGSEPLEAGDAGFLADRVDSATPEDYDYETGVLVGDLYFTLASTADDGRDATIQLATVVAVRVAASG